MPGDEPWSPLAVGLIRSRVEELHDAMGLMRSRMEEQHEMAKLMRGQVEELHGCVAKLMRAVTAPKVGRATAALQLSPQQPSNDGCAMGQ